MTLRGVLQYNSIESVTQRSMSISVKQKHMKEEGSDWERRENEDRMTLPYLARVGRIP